MASWIGALVGDFAVAILIPLFLFYFADRGWCSLRAALILRSGAVFVAIIATCAATVGAGGEFPAGAVIAAFVCFVWAFRATLRGRGIRLNGWQRLGIIATVAWLLVGFFWGVTLYVSEQTRPVLAEYKLCETVADQKLQNYESEWLAAQGSHAPLRSTDTYAADSAKCSNDFSTQYTIAVAGRWWAALGFAVVPLLLAWGLAWLCASLFRWVRAGFIQREA